MKQMFGTAIKKPVEINWFLCRKYSVVNLKELQEWIKSFNKNFHDVIEFSMGKGRIRVKTLEGKSYLLPDNYVIIRGVEGEFYPCELKIFEKIYDIEKATLNNG